MTRTAIFTIGLPAAGKSTLVAQRYGNTDAVVIDPDAIAAALPHYDITRPELTHEAANDIAQGEFQLALASGVETIVLDTTGTKLSKLFARMEAARTAGYQIHILYVTVPVDVSLQRNAQRERVVPEAVIRQKATEIQKSFEVARTYADTVEVVDNA